MALNGDYWKHQESLPIRTCATDHSEHDKPEAVIHMKYGYHLKLELHRTETE
jgi:hypothetical protein